MTRVCYGLAVGFGIAWKMGVIVIAVALLATMTPENFDVAFSHESRDSHSMVVSKQGSDTTNVTLEVAEGSMLANCSLQDKYGRQLLQVTYDRSGCVLVRWGDAFPVRSGCTATLDGRYYIDLQHNGLHYRFRIRPNRTSGFTIGEGEFASEGLGVTSAGGIVHGPSILD